MKARKVLVIGGSGFVGSAIVRRLSAQGATVLVPTRRRERSKHLILLPGVEVVEADVNDAATLEALVSGMDAVVNLVGILHGDSGSPYGARFKAAHVDLPRRIGEACAAAGVPRLIHMSALGVSPDAPSMYLRSKAAGEEALKSAASGVALTIFRPSVIFGSDDRFTNLFAMMQRVLCVLSVGGVGARLQPVHVEDVARAMVGAIDNPATFGRTYDLAGPTVLTLKEVIQCVGRISGHPRPVIALPAGLARMQAWFMEFMPFQILSRDNLDSLKVDSVSSNAFAPELGVTPVSMEAVLPGYLSGRSPRERYMQLRDHARR